MDFQLNFLEKAYFMPESVVWPWCGRPVLSWKTPWDSTKVKKFQHEYTVILTYNISKKAIKQVNNDSTKQWVYIVTA